MGSLLHWYADFDLEIKKLVELSGINPLTSTMLHHFSAKRFFN
jgi:hypothetical protein